MSVPLGGWEAQRWQVLKYGVLPSVPPRTILIPADTEPVGALQRIGGLVVETAGTGDAVLLLMHGAITFDSCRPLLHEPALSRRFRIIHYYRRGYGGSDANDPENAGMEDLAREAADVLDGLGVPRAHVLGHSIGALIALQLAMDRPDMVESLILLEPTFVSRPELGAAFQQVLGPVVEAYTSGSPELAADRMLQVIDGPSYRARLDAAFGPGWLDRASDALDMYFRSDLPAALGWTLTPGRASSIRQPALIVVGEHTREEFAAVAEDVTRWLPAATAVVIPGATHNVAACQPEATAAAIVAFMPAIGRPAPEAAG